MVNLEDFLPTWPILITSIISFLIIVLFLYFFTWKSIHKNLKERQNFIDKNIKNSISQFQKSKLDQKLASEKLLKVQIESKNILNKNKQNAELIKSQIEKNALKEAKKILDNAEQLADLRLKKVKQDSKKIIVDLAIKTTSKLIKKNVDERDAAKLVDQFVDEVDK